MKRIQTKTVIQAMLASTTMVLLSACGGVGGASGGVGGTGDITPPVITLKGNQVESIIETNVYHDLGATAVDAVDGNVTVSVSGSVDTTKVGQYTLTYTAQDSRNNVATETRTVSVVAAQILNSSIPLTPANCKGNVEQEGKDYNGNGQLDAAEITKSTDNYTNGTPVTRADLETKIANGDDVTGVNTCKITDMSELFKNYLAFNQDISGWNTGAVTSMREMFYEAGAFNSPLDSWDTSKVENMSFMFFKATAFNQPVGNWDTSKVENMSLMFFRAIAFNQPVGNWDTSKVENMSFMFSQARAFNQNIDNWKMGKVKYIKGMFELTDMFNQDLSNWDVSKVENMRSIFYRAKAFNQDIGGWDTSSVTDMSYMFTWNTVFNHSLANWDVTKVKTMKAMFKGATGFDQNLGNWDPFAATDMSEMFHGVTLSPLNYKGLLVGWDNKKAALQHDVVFDAGNSKIPFVRSNLPGGRVIFSPDVHAKSARDNLRGNLGWTITDGD